VCASGPLTCLFAEYVSSRGADNEPRMVQTGFSAKGTTNPDYFLD